MVPLRFPRSDLSRKLLPLLRGRVTPLRPQSVVIDCECEDTHFAVMFVTQGLFDWENAAGRAYGARFSGQSVSLKQLWHPWGAGGPLTVLVATREDSVAVISPLGAVGCSVLMRPGVALFRAFFEPRRAGDTERSPGLSTASSSRGHRAFSGPLHGGANERVLRCR